MSGISTVDGVGTIYVFENRHVIHVKKGSATSGVSNSGEFKAGRVKVSYTINGMDGAKYMVLGETINSYPIVIMPGEIEALRQAVLYITDREKMKVFQSRRKPDYGFELFMIQNAQIVSSKRIKKSKRVDILSRA